MNTTNDSKNMNTGIARYVLIVMLFLVSIIVVYLMFVINKEKVERQELREFMLTQQVALEDLAQDMEYMRIGLELSDTETKERLVKLEEMLDIEREKSDQLAKQNTSIDFENIPVDSVVRLSCWEKPLDKNPSFTKGSGVLSRDRLVITNAHVVNGNENSSCLVYIDKEVDGAGGQDVFFADVFAISLVDPKDVALLKITHLFEGNEQKEIPGDYVFPRKSEPCAEGVVELGDQLVVIGYPSIGGRTVTVTEGIVSGFDGDYIKTSAKIEKGNSGGGAFHYSGCWLGIPTIVTPGQLESLGKILRFNY